MRLRLLLAMLINASLFLLAFSPACALNAQSSPTLRVQTSLDVLAEVVDPASQIAHELCTAQKEAITLGVEARHMTAAAGAALLEDAIERCNLQRLTFDRLRALHEQAGQALQSGQLSDAEARLSELREAWRGLGKTAPPPAASTPQPAHAAPSRATFQLAGDGGKT